MFVYLFQPTAAKPSRVNLDPVFKRPDLPALPSAAKLATKSTAQPTPNTLMRLWGENRATYGNNARGSLQVCTNH